MARRLVEKGVRFVQVTVSPGQPWDHHNDIKGTLPKIATEVDQGSAALVKDLKSRGMLDSTIVMWAGEFGRLPTTQNGGGRDHNRNAFTLWFAGGGFKKGVVYGETDDFGYKAVVNRVGVPDMIATVLNQLGLDHKRVQYPYGGRMETLLEILYGSGLRVSELVSLPLVAAERDPQMLMVRGKGDKERQIPLSDPARVANVTYAAVDHRSAQLVVAGRARHDAAHVGDVLQPLDDKHIARLDRQLELVHRRADDGTAPAAADDDDAPSDVPPADWQFGDLARALRQARKRRHE